MHFSRAKSVVIVVGVNHKQPTTHNQQLHGNALAKKSPGGSFVVLQHSYELNGTNRKKKVLVVDDDDAIRTMLERVLRHSQYEVEGARDGFEAIEKLARNDYSTVLLDLMMPRVDGHGVLRFLENEHNEPTPPVIVMTANLPGVSETQSSKPVFRVLPKPFDISQLLAHVHASMAEPASNE